MQGTRAETLAQDIPVMDMFKQVLNQVKKMNENLSMVTERKANELLHEPNSELSGNGEIKNDTQNEDERLSLDGAITCLTSKES